MNERQRDLFLWQWSRRHGPGQTTIVMRGAIIGALGGVLFALIMLCGTGADRGNYTGISAIIPLLTRGGLILALAVPAFGAIGYKTSKRVYVTHEAMYQGLLAAGHQVPDEKPVLQTKDR